MDTDSLVSEHVRRYYGEVLGGSKDLKTNACCTVEPFPVYQREILAQIHDEVRHAAECSPWMLLMAQIVGMVRADQCLVYVEKSHA